MGLEIGFTREILGGK
ncbi:Protein of unknown function [Bacillus cereus]|nr:Protein of unknown function [Bacillus cereus]